MHDSEEAPAAPILVTGATGRMGGYVVAALLEAGLPVRALTRDPARAELAAEVDVVGGDFTNVASLVPCLEGVASVFLLWTAPLDTAEAVIERLQSSVRSVVYLSAPFRTPHPFFQQPNPMAEMHAEIERLLDESRLEVTILRPGMFMSNAQFWWAPAISAGRPVRWPFAGVRTAPVDERDVGEVAARLLRTGQANGDFVLTGPESISQEDQVRQIGEVLRRPIEFHEVSAQEFRQETSATWPAPVVDMLLNAWQASAGHPAYVTTAVPEILGRPARSFRDWVSDHAMAFN